MRPHDKKGRESLLHREGRDARSSVCQLPRRFESRWRWQWPEKRGKKLPRVVGEDDPQEICQSHLRIDMVRLDDFVLVYKCRKRFEADWQSSSAYHDVVGRSERRPGKFRESLNHFPEPPRRNGSSNLRYNITEGFDRLMKLDVDFRLILPSIKCMVITRGAAFLRVMGRPAPGLNLPPAPIASLYERHFGHAARLSLAPA